MTLADFLREEGLVDEAALWDAARRSRRRGIPLVVALVEDGPLTQSQLLDRLERRLLLPRFDPEQATQVEPEALRQVSYDMASRRLVLPLVVLRRGVENVLRLAVADPFDREARDEIEDATGYTLDLVLAGATALQAAIERAYRGEVTQMIRRDSASHSAAATVDLPEQATQPGVRIAEEAPIELRLAALLMLLENKGFIDGDEYRDAVARLLERTAEI